MGGHDPHIHPGPGGGAQGGSDGLVNGQVGGGEVEVPLGLGDHLQVEVGADGVGGVGGVGIGDHDAAGGVQGGQGPGTEEPEVGPGILVVPHGQEKDREAPHRLPPEAEGVVLPVAEAFLPVNVFVGHVQAADKAGHPVNDADFPVIPVVLVNGEHRQQGLEHPAEDAPGVELVRVVDGQGGGGAYPVVDHPDIHALGGFAGEDVQDVRPHGPLGDDEVFQKDIVFRLFQLLQKVGEKGRAGGKIRGLRVGVGRAQGGVPQVPGLLHGVGPIPHQVRGGQPGGQLALEGPPGLLPVVVGVAGAAQDNEHDPADQRDQEDGDDPGNFIGQLGFPGGDEQCHHQADQHADPVEVDEILGKEDQQHHIDGKLQGNAGGNEEHALPAGGKGAVNFLLDSFHRDGRPFLWRGRRVIGAPHFPPPAALSAPGAGRGGAGTGPPAGAWSRPDRARRSAGRGRGQRGCVPG